MERHFDPILRDELYTERLENGLTVAVLVKPGFRQATGRVAVQYGSIDSCFVDPQSGDEVQVPDGIAHFLEHKLFEGPDGNVADRFAELGADVNAYTTHTHTVYYFTTTDHFAACLDLLLNFVQEPYFTPESVAREQGIIEQEIRMYLDDPGWRSSANLMEALFVRHPVRLDIAGTVESIRRIDQDLLYLCHRIFYHPSNMVLFVAGDLDPRAVVEQARAAFAGRRYPAQAPIQRRLPEEPQAIAQRRRVQELVVSQPIFRLGFKEKQVGLTGRPLLERDLLTAILLDVLVGKGSPLYTRLYESGLIDQRFGFGHAPEVTFGYTYVSGPTPDPERLEAELLEGLARAREEGIQPGDFERARRKLVGRILNLMNDLEGLSYLFIDGFFKGIGLFDEIPALQSLTLDAANQRLREHFDAALAATSVISPRP
ncbi:EF-P 5-aminopentanol modification-associated protein YfmH [Symbiobacterium thermophilum]|uniref:Peptidase M16 n=1 Tax=Symbiobacterium thermophilum TaxID=2734 RepID=A0A953IBS3_SYMTR|nr:pitrilysin family protein [Symbiobacterium thermophilum]MBY6277829.1 peptidase M16 [Symbiobacterium thermophilum]